MGDRAKYPNHHFKRPADNKCCRSIYTKTAIMNIEKRSLLAFGVVLLIITLFPILLAALAFISRDSIGLLFIYLMLPVIGGLYPYLIAGFHSTNGNIVYYSGFPNSLLPTAIHWLALSIIFSIIAKKFSGLKLVVAAGIYIFVIIVATHLVLFVAGIELLVPPLRN